MKFRDRGVQFFGLTLENDLSREAVEKFIEQHGVLWPVGLSAHEMYEALGVKGIPTVAVVGRDGRVAWIGHPGGNGLEQSIDQALAASKPQ